LVSIRIRSGPPPISWPVAVWADVCSYAPMLVVVDVPPRPKMMSPRLVAGVVPKPNRAAAPRSIAGVPS
jgi:hypothetical protein